MKQFWLSSMKAAEQSQKVRFDSIPENVVWYEASNSMESRYALCSLSSVFIYFQSFDSVTCLAPFCFLYGKNSVFPSDRVTL
jgi:hypothetical protein